ncbi:MAG: sulfite exporter TauE/SafE family protein [Ideonella sp.]|nr:sulfite exporter TauE/SafE family protein [Ideonella sp.]MCC7458248.1 sulfite exporter TauE/SafE family protein [Nitrospira sp.]
MDALTALLVQVPLLQWLGVALVAFAAAVLGGLAGYGTGLILPIALAPVIGVANVIPVMAVAMMINNASRVVAFRREIQWPHVRRMLWLGLPTCLLGAWGYTRLDARWVALLLGLFLLASIPLRRAFKRAQLQLGAHGEVAAGGAFGFIEGGMTGTGVILISLLMAAGVQGAALIATDALVSAIMSGAKSLLFGSAARLDAGLALAGVLVGLCTAPGAFVARAILTRMPQRIHHRIMEAVVVCGGLGFLWRAW